MAGNKPVKAKRNFSPQEIERRRENMRRLQAEGKVGPQFGKLGGRPRKPKAQEAVAQAAEKNANKIVKVYEDALKDKSTKIRLQAAKELLEFEQKMYLNEKQDEKDIHEMTKDEIILKLAELMQNGPAGLAISQAIDVEAVEITENDNDGFN